MLAPGTHLGSYDIRGSLGAGGMGEVYRAHDRRLGRDVALKILPQAVAGDAARLERFSRETRAIAALNHPHIVTIFSTEESDGVRFFTMELVEGQTLDAIIPHAGLPLARFLEIALPIADALSAAHQKQITHRDLKPANVMVSNDGRVKVLDFGLARQGDSDRAALEATRVTLTHEGTVVGTMPYMSPEQVEGRAVDHRSDLFSLGVLFYEMLAGARPFQGESSAMLMSSILRDAHPELHDRRSDLPEALVRLVSRCLEKRPDDRVQTARDVFNELRHVQRQLESGAPRRPSSDSHAAVTGGVRSSIAVLPFTARGGDEVMALAEGLTDDITTGLSRFSYLRVVSRVAVDRVNEPAAESRAAAAQLGARYLMEGAVRRAGHSVRVTARLVDADTGGHLWAESYDRDFGAGVFVLLDDVASRIVSIVADPSGMLVRSMVAALRDRPSTALSVADLTLQYFAHLEQFTPEQHARLRADLEAALERQPNDALGWGCLSNLYAQEHELGHNPRPDSIARQRRAAERAIAMDHTCQYGWMNLASAHYYSHDVAAFTQNAERAIALNPLNTHALTYLGSLLAFAGQWDRGAALVQQALTLNPHLPGHVHFVPFLDAYRRGDDEAALLHTKKVNIPELHVAQLARAAAAGRLARVEEARAAVDHLRHASPGLLEPAHARAAWSRLIQDRALVDQLIDGLERALAFAEGAPSRSAAAGAAGAAPAPGGGSIAVLPFTDLSPGHDQSWFCDGIAEEIINTLARVPNLKVIARTSAFAFKGQNVPVTTIAEALNVKTVLEGSVRRADQRIRVTAQLVEAADGTQLWSERYDRDIADVFAVQDEIATSITRALRGHLAPAVHVARGYRPRVEAYEAYLMAKHHVWNFSPNWYDVGLEHYHRAIALDSGYAAPFIGLAELFHIHASSRGEQARASAARIRGVVEEALARDPHLGEAHAWRGVFASTYEYDWVEAGRSFDRALAADPGPRIRHLAGYFYLRFRDAHAAVDEHRRALGEGDPLSLITRVGLVMSLFSAGRHDEAARESQRLRELSPEFRATYSLLAFDLANEPLSAALSFAQRLYELAPFSAGSAGLLAGLLRRAGEFERAEALWREVAAVEDYGHAIDHALYHLATGEVDRAFDAMIIARDQRHPFVMMVLVGGPYGELLRRSPRWGELKVLPT
jgi:eukaryotic-like serine/threonine-protein kinase